MRRSALDHTIRSAAGTPCKTVHALRQDVGDQDSMAALARFRNALQDSQSEPSRHDVDRTVAHRRDWVADCSRTRSAQNHSGSPSQGHPGRCALYVCGDLINSPQFGTHTKSHGIADRKMAGSGFPYCVSFFYRGNCAPSALNDVTKSWLVRTSMMLDTGFTAVESSCVLC